MVDHLAFVEAHLVLTALPEICCLILPSNSKELLFKTNSAMLRRSSAGIFFCSRLSRACLECFCKFFHIYYR